MRDLIEESFRFLETDYGYEAIGYEEGNRRYVGRSLVIEAFFWDIHSSFDLHFVRKDSGERTDIRSLLQISDPRVAEEITKLGPFENEARIRTYASALKQYGSDLISEDFSCWEGSREDYSSALQKKRKWIAKFESMSPDEQYLELRKRKDRQPDEGGNSE